VQSRAVSLGFANSISSFAGKFLKIESILSSQKTGTAMAVPDEQVAQSLLFTSKVINTLAHQNSFKRCISINIVCCISCCSSSFLIGNDILKTSDNTLPCCKQSLSHIHSVFNRSKDNFISCLLHTRVCLLILE